jgi:amino acid permease
LPGRVQNSSSVFYLQILPKKIGAYIIFLAEDKDEQKELYMASRQMSDLWRIKPIDLILKQSDETEHGLKRTLTAFSITLLGIGAIVGTGLLLTGSPALPHTVYV